MLQSGQVVFDEAFALEVGLATLKFGRCEMVLCILCSEILKAEGIENSFKKALSYTWKKRQDKIITFFSKSAETACWQISELDRKLLHACRLRNHLFHGLVSPTEKSGRYRCEFIDRDGYTSSSVITKNILKYETENMIEAIALLSEIGGRLGLYVEE